MDAIGDLIDAGGSIHCLRRAHIRLRGMNEQLYTCRADFSLPHNAELRYNIDPAPFSSPNSSAST